MSKSKRRPAPKAQLEQSERRRPTAEPGRAAKRLARLSAPQLLDRIERTRLVRDGAEAELGVLVDQAVDLGIGWPEIAGRLGVTRQAARQQYHRRHHHRPGTTGEVA
jgi:hypothetical protein